LPYTIKAQILTKQVNVFLGSSGDHGQLSPGASSAFYQMNILPHTYPQIHTGYEHLAKKIIGFTHNRIEGTGCKGSGGLIMIKPYLGNNYQNKYLHKRSENAGPGYYEIELEEQISASFTTFQDFGIHEYKFPLGNKGFILDFDYALNNAVVSNTYTINQNMIIGSIRAKTTCNVGTYTIHYAIQFNSKSINKINDNLLDIKIDPTKNTQNIQISFSAVSEEDAYQTLLQNKNTSYKTLKSKAEQSWENEFERITIKGGNIDRQKLFYSLLYRTLQSPYIVSNQDKSFKATDGNIYTAPTQRYHGWAIWDNYKTQLPLLALFDTKRYQDIIYSISNLYKYGKYDFAGPNEPSNSVRTEHAAIVLLDANEKGFDIPLSAIKENLITDTSTFDFSKPDKFLEATYDMWAMSKLIPEQKVHFLNRANTYKNHWTKEFKDLTKNDVDKMSARQMYQGTIRQYRWNVPYDTKGLIELIGNQDIFTQQLDDFFDNHYFNRANEPDIQSPSLYYASSKPWRYQSLIHELALDTIIQYYFNDNSRGISPSIDRIYKNEPKAFIRTMDDDAGAMSAWFVLSAIGLQQPLIGHPIYYLSVPFFPEISIHNGTNSFKINVKNFSDQNRYIKSIQLNGKEYNKLWISHQDLTNNSTLTIEATDKPTNFGTENMYISKIN